MSLSKLVKRGKKKPKEESKVYRYFCRTSNGIVHMKNKPETGTIIGKLKLKKIGYYLYVVNQVNSSKKFNKKAFTKIPISVLKSNLQKAIRRGQTEIALKTACLMIIKSPREFLRRLSIIYIEDVSMDNFFSIIMWYMCANVKGYQLNYNDVSWLLGCVKHLSTKLDAWVPKERTDLTINDVREKILTGNFDNYLLPLVYRYEFNGFDGELKLILNYIQNYQDRTEIESFKLVIPSKYYIFERSDLLKSAIDFHCSSLIEYLLTKYSNSDWTEEFLKQIIWVHRSSINYRKSKKNFRNSFYDCIKRDCDEYADILIDDYFT